MPHAVTQINTAMHIQQKSVPSTAAHLHGVGARSHNLHTLCNERSAEDGGGCGAITGGVLWAMANCSAVRLTARLQMLAWMYAHRGVCMPSRAGSTPTAELSLRAVTLTAALQLRSSCPSAVNSCQSAWLAETAPLCPAPPCAAADGVTAMRLAICPHLQTHQAAIQFQLLSQHSCMWAGHADCSIR